MSVIKTDKSLYTASQATNNGISPYQSDDKYIQYVCSCFQSNYSGKQVVHCFQCSIALILSLLGCAFTLAFSGSSVVQHIRTAFRLLLITTSSRQSIVVLVV